MFAFVCLLHQFCAVTMSDTRVEALPIMYRQSRTDLPLSTDLKLVFYSSGALASQNCWRGGNNVLYMYIVSCLTSVHTRFVQ